MTSATSSALTDTVASVLCRDVAWQTLSATADTFWDACEMHGTLHLLSERIRRRHDPVATPLRRTCRRRG